MNQTKKRLSIIKIAISITDIETIQLQILKLALLRTDKKIQNIIHVLQSENYAQAQGLITDYIETPSEEILQRSSQKTAQVHTQEECSTIEEFQLFVNNENNLPKEEIDINDYINDDLEIPAYTPTKVDKEPARDASVLEIDINDFLSFSPNIPLEKENKYITEIPTIATGDFDALLNINVDDVLLDNIDLNIHYGEEDNFFTLPSQSVKTNIAPSHIPQDNFFDIPKEEVLLPKASVDLPADFPAIEESPADEFQEHTSDEFILENEKKELAIPTLPQPTNDDNTPKIYNNIPYIAQKLENLHKQYPSAYSKHETFPVLAVLLRKISQEVFTEEEIEETLVEVKNLIASEEFAQASQLLLVCAATPSLFAKLLLARELYKGILFTQNTAQAFILLNTLAMDDYPEALCDLGQFYENGIGSKKDKKRAAELYENAMNLGIKRAKAHFERLDKKNKGFFGR